MVQSKYSVTDTSAYEFYWVLRCGVNLIELFVFLILNAEYVEVDMLSTTSSMPTG